MLFEWKIGWQPVTVENCPDSYRENIEHYEAKSSPRVDDDVVEEVNLHVNRCFMKKIWVFILLVALHSSSYAHDTFYFPRYHSFPNKKESNLNDTLYFYLNDKFQRVNAGHASYVRKALRTKHGEWMTLDYTLSHKLFAIRYFSDTNFQVRLNCHYFYDTIKMYRYRMLCFYNGKVDGRAIDFNEKGDTVMIATYSQGEQIAHEEFPGYGERDIDKREPRFPGGAEEWQAFLKKNLHYPKTAVVLRTQGTVIVSFMVSQEGKLSDFRIEKSADPVLDEETIRIMKLSPDWLPAERDGKKISMRHSQPLTFKLH